MTTASTTTKKKTRRSPKSPKRKGKKIKIQLNIENPLQALSARIKDIVKDVKQEAGRVENKIEDFYSRVKQVNQAQALKKFEAYKNKYEKQLEKLRKDIQKESDEIVSEAKRLRDQAEKTIKNVIEKRKKL